MSSNFGKWRFEKKPLLISLLFGAISLFLLLMISNLEFVKESSRTFEGTDGLFWTFVIAAGMGSACYAVMLCVEDYLSELQQQDRQKGVYPQDACQILPTADSYHHCRFCCMRHLWNQHLRGADQPRHDLFCHHLPKVRKQAFA